MKMHDKTNNKMLTFNMGTQDDVVMVTKSTIMEGTHKDPKFTSSVIVAAAEEITENVD